MALTSERMLQTASGQYRVFDLIASGAFGSVYYGRSLRDGSPVAIKQLHPHHADDARVVARFESEAGLVRGLAHPSIVRVLDQGRTDAGLPFIVMEWVTGWTLAELITRLKRFPPAATAEIGCQVLDGLEAARQIGVIHRDIKPLNIMVTAEGRAKIMDFGIAKATDLAALTGTSGTLGTPAYMAPEQFEGRAPDTRADLYSLGVVLYEMLAGDVPFHASSVAAVIYQHLRVPPPPGCARGGGGEPRGEGPPQRPPPPPEGPTVTKRGGGAGGEEPVDEPQV